jgi:hypothetical protein
MAAPRRDIHYAAAYALRAFLLSLLLPIWTAYYFGDREISGEMTWFPVMLDSLFKATKRESRQTLFEYYDMELVKVSAVLVAGAVFGLSMARRPVKPS